MNNIVLPKVLSGFQEKDITGVIVVITKPDETDEILYLAGTRRGTMDDWGLIGGKVDKGIDKTPNDAIQREIYEETGYMIKHPLEPLWVFKDGDMVIATYRMTNPEDIYNICDPFLYEHSSIEPGILVGLIPVEQLFTGSFGLFNQQLMNMITIRDNHIDCPCFD